MVAEKRPTSPAELSPFASVIDQFLRRHFKPSHGFLAACSAGPDSVALVHALHEISRCRPLLFDIAHVNHRLRGAASTDDQRFVERLGRRLDVPVQVVARPVSAGEGNLEERARDARYKALLALARRRRRAAILTAHTQNDQAETVVMNLLRGSGVDGLGGIRPVRAEKGSPVLIARPMLALERTQAHAFARSHGGFRLDASNTDQKFLRNYVRLSLFEGLRKRAPGFEERVARLAELVRDEAPVLDALADAAMARTGRKYRGGWLIDRPVFDREPVAVQRRVLRKAAGCDVLRFADVERLRSWMDSPPTNGRVWQLRKGWFVERLSRAGGSSSPSLFWFRQSPPKKEH